MARYYSKYCYIYINGVELNEQRYRSITDVVYNQTIEGSDSVVISITDSDAIFIEDDIFIEDTPVKIVFGINEIKCEWVFEGEINDIDLDFPEHGDITLNINCIDNSNRMNKVTKTRTFTNMRNVDIVKEIVESYGLNFKIVNEFSFKNYDSISQDDISDLEFIEQLRDDEVFPSYAKMYDPTTFCFQTITFVKPVICTLSYRINPFDIISFSPTISRSALQEGMLKSEVDLQNLEIEINSQATFDYASKLTTGDLPVTSVRPDSTIYNYSGISSTGYMYGGGDSANVGVESAKLYSEAEKEMLSNSISVLEGTLQIIPNENNVVMKIADTINILGLGRYLSGMYVVRGITLQLTVDSISIDVIKTGFGDSIKSSTIYMEVNDPDYVEDEDTATTESTTIDSIDSAEKVVLEFTAYAPTGDATASGVYPTENHTCAGWSDLPFGTQIYVPSLGQTYTVEDRGGAVTYGIIDIYMGSEEECIAFGRQELEAYIIRL